MRRDLEPIRPGDESTIELKLLTERRTDLVAERTRTVNRKVQDIDTAILYDGYWSHRVSQDQRAGDAPATGTGPLPDLTGAGEELAQLMLGEGRLVPSRMAMTAASSPMTADSGPSRPYSAATGNDAITHGSDGYLLPHDRRQRSRRVPTAPPPATVS